MIYLTSRGRWRVGIQAFGAAFLVITGTFMSSLFAGSAVTASNGPTTEVSVSAPNSVAAGSTFTAFINVSRVDNFDAGNYDVSFNPSVLALENVAAGQIGSVYVPIELWHQRSAGRYTIVQNIPGIAGVSGTGSLAVLHFRVIGSGGQSSLISLSNGMLSNSMAEAIAATWGSGSVQIGSGQPATQGAQQTPTLLPGAGTTQSPPVTSNATSVATESPLPSPPDSEDIGALKTLPVSQQPIPVPSVTPFTMPVLVPGPQPSEAQEAARVAGQPVNAAPPISPSASKLNNQAIMIVIWLALGGAVFIIGLIVSLVTTRRKSR